MFATLFYLSDRTLNKEILNMADIDNTNVQTTETTATTEPAEKTFTQTEVNNLIANRLERERKKYPSETELAEYNSWKAGQADRANTLNTITAERDNAKNSLATLQAQYDQLKNERYLLSKGVPEDDVEYYAFKISKLVDDKTTFEQATDNYLKDNKPKAWVRFSTGASMSGGTNKENTSDMMNALIRDRARK